MQIHMHSHVTPTRHQSIKVLMFILSLLLGNSLPTEEWKPKVIFSADTIPVLLICFAALQVPQIHHELPALPLAPRSPLTQAGRWYVAVYRPSETICNWSKLTALQLLQKNHVLSTTAAQLSYNHFRINFTKCYCINVKIRYPSEVTEENPLYYKGCSELLFIIYVFQFSST